MVNLIHMKMAGKAVDAYRGWQNYSPPPSLYDDDYEYKPPKSAIGRFFSFLLTKDGAAYRDAEIRSGVADDLEALIDESFEIAGELRINPHSTVYDREVIRIEPDLPDLEYSDEQKEKVSEDICKFLEDSGMSSRLHYIGDQILVEVEESGGFKGIKRSIERTRNERAASGAGKRECLKRTEGEKTQYLEDLEQRRLDRIARSKESKANCEVLGRTLETALEEYLGEHMGDYAPVVEAEPHAMDYSEHPKYDGLMLEFTFTGREERDLGKPEVEELLEAVGGWRLADLSNFATNCDDDRVLRREGDEFLEGLAARQSISNSEIETMLGSIESLKSGEPTDREISPEERAREQVDAMLRGEDGGPNTQPSHSPEKPPATPAPDQPDGPKTPRKG